MLLLHMRAGVIAARYPTVWKQQLQAHTPLWCLSGKRHYCPAPKGQHSLPYVLWKAKEAKHSHTNICTRCPPAHSWTPTLLIPPKHNNWPPVCDAKAPMTAFGQHSMVPPFYTNRASPHRARRVQGTLSSWGLAPFVHSVHTGHRRCTDNSHFLRALARHRNPHALTSMVHARRFIAPRDKNPEPCSQCWGLTSFASPTRRICRLT